VIRTRPRTSRPRPPQNNNRNRAVFQPDHVMTFDVILGSLKAPGAVFQLGPSAAIYSAQSYGLSALCYNNYRITAVTLTSNTLLNQYQATGNILFWLSGDPQATLPKTDVDLQGQCMSSKGISQFTGLSLNNKTMPMPRQQKTMYSTGNGDSSGTGQSFENQLNLMAAIVAGDKNTVNYANLIVRITVRFSGPGMTRVTVGGGPTPPPGNPMDPYTLNTWHEALDAAMMLTSWAFAPSTSPIGYLVVATKAYPVRPRIASKKTPTPPPLRKGMPFMWVREAVDVPTSNSNLQPQITDVMRWDDTLGVNGSWVIQPLASIPEVTIVHQENTTVRHIVRDQPETLVAAEIVTEDKMGQLHPIKFPIPVKSAMEDALIPPVASFESQLAELRTTMATLSTALAQMQLSAPALPSRSSDNIQIPEDNYPEFLSLGDVTLPFIESEDEQDEFTISYPR